MILGSSNSEYPSSSEPIPDRETDRYTAGAVRRSMSVDKTYLETRLANISDVLLCSEQLLAITLRDLVATRESNPVDGVKEQRLVAEINVLEERIRVHRAEEKELRCLLHPVPTPSPLRSRLKSTHSKTKTKPSISKPSPKHQRKAFTSPPSAFSEDSKSNEKGRMSDVQIKLRDASCPREEGWVYHGEHVGSGARRLFCVDRFGDGKIVAMLPEKSNEGIALWYC